jgi:hypothetical protein
MKRSIVILFIFSSLLFGKVSIAQDVLPEFKLKQISPGKIFISWHNPHQNCIKLSVQRSGEHESFKTIISVKKPSLFENSFTDTKSPKNKNTFYRIQYTLKNGKNYFSKTHNTIEKERINSTVSNKIVSNWKASPFVFTNNNGYVQIQVTNPLEYVYKVLFQDENGNELFQIKKVDTDNLILDKTNFIHGGWFQFELYKDDVLLEKNKVYLNRN